jgi:hypothetical protein
MLKHETFTIADIYVPVKRRATLEQKRVDELAASMLDRGQETPILVRSDGARFVLVEVCTGWKLPRRWARKPLLDSASMRASIELLTRSHYMLPIVPQQDCCDLVVIRSAITCPIQGEANGPAPNENA